MKTIVLEKKFQEFDVEFCCFAHQIRYILCCLQQYFIVIAATFDFPSRSPDPVFRWPPEKVLPWFGRRPTKAQHVSRKIRHGLLINVITSSSSGRRLGCAYTVGVRLLYDHSIYRAILLKHTYSGHTYKKEAVYFWKFRTPFSQNFFENICRIRSPRTGGVCFESLNLFSMKFL